MNIFVAGGAGFIGSHLCDALLEKGNTVIVADKLIMGKQNIEHLITNPNFKFYEVELADQSNVDRIFDENEIDAVFSKLSAWKEIGGYDESMFIDSVDFEYCYRMRKYGYGVIQVRDVRLLHELGKSQRKRIVFWKIDVTGHPAFRKYYIARNNIYYPLKHRLWLRLIRGNLRNIGMLVVTLLYEDDKKNKIIAICRGWKGAYQARWK